MRLIFMSFTGQFGHFLNQFIFVSLFVCFCVCSFIVLFVGFAVLKGLVFFYASKPRYLPKRMFHFMVRMFVADHLFITL